jgi:hypothetical protein
MSTAICTVCAKGYNFSGYRGAKLSERRCTCGRALTAAAWTERGFVPRSRDKERLIRVAWELRGEVWDGFAKDESFGAKNY